MKSGKRVQPFALMSPRRALLPLALVIPLLFPRCPPAVARFVIAVIINAIERQSIRARSHISEEIGEQSPTRTDGYTAPTPIQISGRLRIGASIEHLRPRRVSWCFDPAFFPYSSRLCSLFLHPSAIIRFVIPVIVYASKSRPSQTWTHVF